MKYDKELFEENHLYRYFTNEIWSLENKIWNNSRELASLVSKQKELKAGKHKLVELRRETVEKAKNKKQ